MARTLVRRCLHAFLVMVIMAGVATIGSPGLAQGPIRVVAHGRVLRLDPSPVFAGGRILVPLRGVFEALGAFVRWKGLTRTVIIVRAGSYVSLRVGDRTASVGGRSVPLDVPARVIRGRVFVPLRLVGEAIGARVEWRAADWTVVISMLEAQPATPRRVGEVQLITIPQSPPSAPAPLTDLGEPVTVERGKVVARLAQTGLRVGDTIAVTVANGLDQTIYSTDFKTACSIVTLQRRAGAGWEPLTGCVLGRPTLVVAIGSGRGRTISIDPHSVHLRKVAAGADLAFARGSYRIAFTYGLTVQAAEEQIVYSPVFTIR